MKNYPASHTLLPWLVNPGEVIRKHYTFSASIMQIQKFFNPASSFMKMLTFQRSGEKEFVKVFVKVFAQIVQYSNHRKAD